MEVRTTVVAMNVIEVLTELEVTEFGCAGKDVEKDPGEVLGTLVWRIANGEMPEGGTADVEGVKMSTNSWMVWFGRRVGFAQ